MKFKVYLRVAKDGGRGPKVSATMKPSVVPLKKGQGWKEQPLATVAFAVELEIPDSAFRRAEQVLAEIKIPDEQIEVLVEVPNA